MQDILSLAGKISDHAEVYQVHSRRTPVRFEANRLKQVQTKETSATALRIFKNGKIGFAVASGPLKPEELVRMAEETAEFGPAADYELPGKEVYPEVNVFDSTAEDIPIERMVLLGQELISRVRDHTPDVLCEGDVSRQVTEVHLHNSRGAQAKYRRSVFGINFEGVLVREGDLLFVGDGESSCQPITHVDNIVAAMTRQLDLARVLTAAPVGTVPVIFTPIGVASTLVAPISIAFNGKMVVEGASPLKDQRGQSVFDPKFSLWDDATLSLRPSSSPCDDEGVPSRRTTLVDKGVVSNFLYDLNTAKIAGTASTGSGRRSGGLPSPSISSLVVGEGSVSFEEMVKGIKEGLVVEFTMGAEQGNLLSGDFSGNVLLGFSIRDGEIMGRVKDTVVSGNVFEILKNIGLSRESRWVAGFLRTPYICCSGLAVASKGV